MLKTYRLCLILALSLLLFGCSSLSTSGNKTENFFSQTSVKKTARSQYTPTDPTSVMLTGQKNLNTPYKKIGAIKIAQHNFVGIKRQQADINSLLQANAAKLGGNAVIDIHDIHTSTVGTIIKFV